MRCRKCTDDGGQTAGFVQPASGIAHAGRECDGHHEPKRGDWLKLSGAVEQERFTVVLGELIASLYIFGVLAAGVWLPFVGADLARMMGWNNSFVGTLFVAFATSVPELVVTVSALRIGALCYAGAWLTIMAAAWRPQSARRHR